MHISEQSTDKNVPAVPGRAVQEVQLAPNVSISNRGEEIAMFEDFGNGPSGILANPAWRYPSAGNTSTSPETTSGGRTGRWKAGNFDPSDLFSFPNARFFTFREVRRKMKPDLA